MHDDVLQEVSEFLGELVNHGDRPATPAIVNKSRELHLQLLNLLELRANAGGVIEVLHYPQRKIDPYTQLFRHTAQSTFTEDGDFEVDDATMVTHSDDEGEYVLGYKWIPNESVIFPKQYDVEIGYEDRVGNRHYIARAAVIAFAADDATQQMFDSYWDERYSAAACTPCYKEHPVPVERFHVHLQKTGEGTGPQDFVTHDIDAANKNVVLHGLRILYPNLNTDYEVITWGEDGEEWVLSADGWVEAS